jgi:hypothetical protein
MANSSGNPETESAKQQGQFSIDDDEAFHDIIPSVAQPVNMLGRFSYILTLQTLRRANPQALIGRTPDIYYPSGSVFNPEPQELPEGAVLLLDHEHQEKEVYHPLYSDQVGETSRSRGSMWGVTVGYQEETWVQPINTAVRRPRSKQLPLKKLPIKVGYPERDVSLIDRRQPEIGHKNQLYGITAIGVYLPVGARPNRGLRIKQIARVRRAALQPTSIGRGNT